MENLLIYLLQTQICLALLWLLYRFGLSPSGAFAQHRAYLLLTVGVAFIVPLLSIPIYAAETLTVDYYTTFSYVTSTTATPLPPASPYTPLLIGSLIVSAALLGVLIRNLWRIQRIIRNARTIEHQGVKLFYTNQHNLPFSFFHYVVVGNNEQSAEIIAHEMTHVRLHHSLDCLLIEGMRILFWWNPFVWWWGRSLKEVHEFQADQAVLEKGFDTEQYILLLIQGLTGNHPEIVSGFSYSRIKKRLKMIGKPVTGRYAKWRILLALPMITLLLTLFSFTAKPTVYTVSNTPDGQTLVQVSDSQLPGEQQITTGGATPKISIQLEGEDVTSDEFVTVVNSRNDNNSVKKISIYNTTEGAKAITTGDEDPIYYVNGVKTEGVEVNLLKADEIDHIAITKKEEPGEVHITLKEQPKAEGASNADKRMVVVGTRNHKNSNEEKNGAATIHLTQATDKDGIVYYVNGVKTDGVKVNMLKAEEIDKISVLKEGEAAGEVHISMKKMNTATKNESKK